MSVTVWSSTTTTTTTSQRLPMCEALFRKVVKSDWQPLMRRRMSCGVDFTDPPDWPFFFFPGVSGFTGKACEQQYCWGAKAARQKNGFVFHLYYICKTQWTLVSQFWWIILYFIYFRQKLWKFLSKNGPWTVIAAGIGNYSPKTDSVVNQCFCFFLIKKFNSAGIEADTMSFRSHLFLFLGVLIKT